LMLAGQNYGFEEEARQAFREYLELRIRQPQFAHARSVRNAIDRMKLRQASRIVSVGGCVAKAALTRLVASDVRESRVFHGGLEAELEAADAGMAKPDGTEAKERL